MLPPRFSDASHADEPSGSSNRSIRGGNVEESSTGRAPGKKLVGLAQVKQAEGAGASAAAKVSIEATGVQISR
jgi:hypothetical protein